MVLPRPGEPSARWDRIRRCHRPPAAQRPVEGHRGRGLLTLHLSQGELGAEEAPLGVEQIEVARGARLVTHLGQPERAAKRWRLDRATRQTNEGVTLHYTVRWRKRTPRDLLLEDLRTLARSQGFTVEAMPAAVLESHPDAIMSR